MVDVDEVAVELNVEVAASLYGAVCDGGWCGRADACEDCAGGEGDEGDGAAGKRAWVVFYAEETVEVGLDPGRYRGIAGEIGGGIRLCREFAI